MKLFVKQREKQTNKASDWQRDRKQLAKRQKARDRKRLAKRQKATGKETENERQEATGIYRKMPTNRRIDIILPRIKRVIFHKLKGVAFDNDGIIFGGMVRDEICSDHYKSLFYQNLTEKFDNKKFWNESYCPETAARTIVPEDMDISFDSEGKKEKFIQDVLDMFNTQGSFSHTMEDLLHTNEYCLNTRKISRVQRMTINLTVGTIPFVFRGYDLEIQIDIVTPSSSSMLPPFKNLDMLCNSFIMTKHGKMLSQHTGTVIDHLSDLERSIVSSKIIKDITEFKTDFTLGQCLIVKEGSFNLNKYAFKRIEKMLNKHHKWNIQNLPFNVDTFKKKDEKAKEQECCICYSDFTSNKDKVSISTSEGENCIMHQSCLFRYMDHQVEDFECGSNNNPRDTFAFKTPFRSSIDFIASTGSVRAKIYEWIGK